MALKADWVFFTHRGPALVATSGRQYSCLRCLLCRVMAKVFERPLLIAAISINLGDPWVFDFTPRSIGGTRSGGACLGGRRVHTAIHAR